MVTRRRKKPEILEEEFKPTPTQRRKGVFTLGAYELTAEEAKQFGYTLDPGWVVRVTPPPSPKGVVTEGARPSSTFVSPEGWEFRDVINDEAGEVTGYTALSPEGETFTKEELEALEAQPSQEYQDIIASLEPFKTPEGLYDVSRALGTIPKETLIKVFGEEAFQPALTGREASELDVRFEELMQQWKQEKDLEKRRVIGEEISAIEKRLRAPAAPQPTLEESATRMELEAGIMELYPELLTIREGEDVTIEQKVEEAFTFIQQKAFTDTEGFVQDLRAKGRTSATEGLLRSLGVTDMGEVFGGLEPVEPTEQPPLRPEDELAFELAPEFFATGTPTETGWKAVWNKLRTSGSQFWFKTKDYFLTVLPTVLFPDKAEIKRNQPGFPEHLLDQKATQNREMRDAFRAKSAENREIYEEWVNKHPELKPPPEWEGEILTLLKDDPTLILNPAFIGFIAADSAAFMAAFWSATAAVGFVTKNPIAGMAAGVAVTTPAQSQDLYEDLLWAGAKEKQAAQLAIPVGLLISSVEMVGGLAVLKAVGAMPGMRPFYQLLRRNVQRELGKSILKEMTKRGLTSFTEIELSEIFEEIIQQSIQNALVKTFDESREVLGGITETILRTFISVLPLGILGGGTNVAQTYRQMSPNQRQQVEQRQTALEDAGIPPEQAEMIAVTEVLETEEGQTVVKEAMEQAEITPEVTPTPRGELVQPSRRVEPTEEAVTPTAPVARVEPEVGEVTPRVRRGEKGFVRLPGEPEPVRTLPLEEISKLETRIPIDLIRRDEAVEIKRLTEEIRREGITEPITIRVREDGSMMVWDGIHRLIVAQVT